MQYTFGSKGKARFFAALLLGLVALACAVFIQHSMAPSRFVDPTSMDLSGEWKFHNGPLSETEKNYEERIVVPNPIPDSIRKNLKDEFWYQTEFLIPSKFMAGDLSLSLGSVKGVHSVYWNGKFLGSGGKTGLGLYRIPNEYLTQGKIRLNVRVYNSAALFPGIVHMNRIYLGEARNLEKQLDYYYFDTGVKPLFPALFKLALFFFFVGFFAAVPYKREYLSFSLFAVFAALSSSFYSRFLPGYESAEFKNGMVFLFSMLSIGLIPALSADFLRLPERPRSYLRIFGGSLALIFISASLLVQSADQKLAVYRLGNEWIPSLAILPSLLISIVCVRSLEPSLKHRKVQISVFSVFLVAGLLSWGSGSSALLKFQLFQLREFLDLVVFAGLGTAVAMDFRQTATRSEKASRVVPKWFSGFLAGGVDRVVIEIPLVAMAIDTVGYTKHLASLPLDRREEFHAGIRNSLAVIVDQLHGQKISERGDGGIFAWDLPANKVDQQKILSCVLEASRKLAEVTLIEGAKSFRIGISCGMVRGEMNGSDISFLGEALNCAARLESLAEPGSALVDESLVNLIAQSELGDIWIEAELKGVVYRAKPLMRAVA